MDFATWFQTWLTRHPLKAPGQMDRARFTQDVMARITAPASAPTAGLSLSNIRLVLGWPRLALIAATVAVGVLIFIGTVHRAQVQLAGAIDQDAQVMTAFDELLPMAPAGNGTTPEDVAQELQVADLLVLAESTPSDDQWLDQTLQLLQQLDEDVPADVTGTGGNASESSEDWLNELRQIDETELAASS